MREKRLFTRVELVVVITILAIIASLHLPATAVSAKKAQQMQCLSNLKQMGMFAVAYANDSNGLLPSAWYTLTNPKAKVSRNWFLGKDLPLYQSGKKITKTVPDDSFMICPTITPEQDKKSTYGFNDLYPKKGTRTVTMVRKPSKLMICSENTGFRSNLSYSLENPLERMYFRHEGESINVCFLDGHVENRTMDMVPTMHYEQWSLLGANHIANSYFWSDAQHNDWANKISGDFEL